LSEKTQLRLLIDKKTINKRLKILAGKISKDYRGKSPLFIGVLNGSFVFLSDFIRMVNLDAEIDFIKLQSYRNRKKPGTIKLLSELNENIKDRDVIIVEDIIDSGKSVNYIKELISLRKPSSLEFVSLLCKRGSDKLNFKIKYIGFKIPDEFVVGYGLDYAGKYRNLKEIYILKN